MSYIFVGNAHNNGGGGGGAVDSVNGQTGVVVLEAGDIGGGTANTITGFDGSGNLFSIPGFNIDTTSGGLNQGIVYNPDDLGGTVNSNVFSFSLDPLQDSPDDNYVNQGFSLYVNPSATAFDIGSNGEAANNLNLFIQVRGTGDVGFLNQIKFGADIGSGTDAFTMTGINTAVGYLNINDLVTINGSVNGYTFNPVISSGAIRGGSYNLNAFADYSDININVNSHTSFASNPNLVGVLANNGVTLYQASPQIDNLITNASVTYYGGYGAVTTMGASAYVKGYDFSPNIATSHGFVNGMSINPNINGGDANYTGIQIGMGGSATGLQSIKGIQIQLGTVPTTDPQGPVSLETDARIQANSTTTLRSAQTFQIGTRIANLFDVPSGSPVTGTDSLNVNIAGDLWAKDDVADGITGGLVGVTQVGFISSIIAASGVTVDTVNVFLAAGSIPAPPSGTDGGTIANLSMIRTAPLLPSGGVLNITNIKAFNISGDFVSSATDAWGLWVEDSALDNYFGGQIAIGTSSQKVTNSSIAFEIGGTTKALRLPVLTTTQKNALTALEGMVVFDTTTNLLEFYDGSTWSAGGGGGGANTTLSNLGVTAINADLITAGDPTDNTSGPRLGAAGAVGGWNRIYALLYAHPVTGTTIIDFDAGVIGDSTGTGSIDFETRKLLASDGSSVVFDYANPVDSLVQVKGGNGYGSTNTKFRRFTTAVTNTGTDITYADSASNGGTFTINTTGMYTISFRDKDAVARYFGVSRNGDGTNNIELEPVFSSQIAITFNVAGAVNGSSWTGKLVAGDVIAMHTDGGSTNTDDDTNFSIELVYRGG